MLLVLPLEVAGPTRFSLELAASVTSGSCSLFAYVLPFQPDSPLLCCCGKTLWSRQHTRERVYFGSWFQRLRVHHGREAWQQVTGMVEEAESSLLEPRAPAREQTGSLPSLNDILPPRKLHLTKVPELPQTASPTENQVFKSLSQGVGGELLSFKSWHHNPFFSQCQVYSFYACFWFWYENTITTGDVT